MQQRFKISTLFVNRIASVGIGAKETGILVPKLFEFTDFFIRSFTSDTSIPLTLPCSNIEETFVKLFGDVNRPLLFSVDSKIPSLGSTVPVGNKASWNGGPSG